MNKTRCTQFRQSINLRLGLGKSFGTPVECQDFEGRAYSLEKLLRQEA